MLRTAWLGAGLVASVVVGVMTTSVNAQTPTKLRVQASFPPTSVAMDGFRLWADRVKVMSAGRIMRPVSNGARYVRQVEAGEKVASFAAEIVGAKASFGVVGSDGKLLGEVTADSVIDLLAGLDQAKAP